MTTARPSKKSSIPAARARREDTKPQPPSRPSSTMRGAPVAPRAAPAPPAPVILGDSAVAVARRPTWQRHDVPSASRRGGRLVRAKAAALFSGITAAGIAEVQLLGLPDWVNLLFVVAALAVAMDWLHLVRRRAQANASQWLETRTLPSLPAPAVDPPAVDRAGAQSAADDPAESELSATDADDPAEIDPSATNANDDDTAAEDALPQPQRGQALGYTTVPSGDHGEQLPLDTRDVSAWCEQRGVTVLKMVHDVEGSGERAAGPALAWALDRIAAGEVDTLVVPRLQCLAPTVGSLPPLLRWFTEPQRALVAIDLQLDTATDAGRVAAHVLAGVGSWENKRLSVRTRRGLEAARSRGAGRAGAAVADVPELRERIVRMREEGKTLQAIADVLNEEGVPTLRGGAKWRPSSVQSTAGYRRPPTARGIQLPTLPDGSMPPAGTRSRWPDAGGLSQASPDGVAGGPA